MLRAAVRIQWPGCILLAQHLPSPSCPPQAHLPFSSLVPAAVTSTGQSSGQLVLSLCSCLASHVAPRGSSMPTAGMSCCGGEWVLPDRPKRCNHVYRHRQTLGCDCCPATTFFMFDTFVHLIASQIELHVALLECL